MLIFHKGGDVLLRGIQLLAAARARLGHGLPGGDNIPVFHRPCRVVTERFSLLLAASFADGRFGAGRFLPGMPERFSLLLATPFAGTRLHAGRFLPDMTERFPLRLTALFAGAGLRAGRFLPLVLANAARLQEQAADEQDDECPLHNDPHIILPKCRFL